ncbi:MAG: hypothetical protein BWY35_00581 [Firmicutes bacterium ADurb.Bin248]|nr:MAG: hypothetical protein BWY35_00581 [Firmicutes bacterium ADurb.Bin248]HOG02115.1 CehA/McbA family metallohydrolase [Clostridia bacterium]HPK16541.1 CehA/McbA family metallohydrolase [Clostridia bacterium]
MDIQYLLPHGGCFYKANLHCHSVHSDGKLSPAQLKSHYKACGYSVLAYTDHNVYNDFTHLSEADFLVLAGYELDVTTSNGADVFPKACHINAIAIDPKRAFYVSSPAAYDFNEINRTIAKLTEAGFIVNFNHPGWSVQDAREILALEGLTCFEVYNNECEVKTFNGYGHQHYDIWLKSGKRAFAIATDDNHDVYSEHGINDMCGGWTMFKAQTLSYTAILDALRRGEFYASNGPAIYNYYVKDGKLCVDCSPVRLIVLKSMHIGGSKSVTMEGTPITHAEFDLSEPDIRNFARLELVDINGRAAFTNPYYL